MYFKNKCIFAENFFDVKVDANPLVEGKLYAFWFDGDNGNVYTVAMERMYDREWLWNFFTEHKKDLGYFYVSDINDAIERTIDDLDMINDFLLDGTKTLDTFFHDLSYDWHDPFFQRSKGKLAYLPQMRHNSWVRLYAIKIENDIYVITGGTIKLTEKMQDREHTRKEVLRLEKCRDYLVSLKIFDFIGFRELFLCE